MSWLKEVPPPHKCEMPGIYYLEQSVGSIWQCDDCGRLWKFRGFEWGSDKWRRIRRFRQRPRATFSDPPPPPRSPKPGQGPR